ncbi:MAG TPA: hypothetical protein VFK06_25255 [Candidatus Angelobacter sp.]|nr:hypothetical protein [Candidatus Angelobacter sp.]
MIPDDYRPTKKDLDRSWELLVAYYDSKDVKLTDADSEFISLVQLAFYISPTGNYQSVENCGTAVTIGEARRYRESRR